MNGAGWWDALVACWWPDDAQVQPTEEVRRWLQSKHDVAARLKPRTIGEIGVRAGYSAFAMLSAVPEAAFVGIDVGDSDLYGSEPGALDHARRILTPFKTAIVEVDSHALGRLPPLDLLHVDGDHSFQGCTSDLTLADRSGVRWVLVDDYRCGPVVCAAVDQLAELRGWNVETIEDGFRGSALIDLHGGS